MQIVNPMIKTFTDHSNDEYRKTKQLRNKHKNQTLEFNKYGKQHSRLLTRNLEEKKNQHEENIGLLRKMHSISVGRNVSTLTLHNI
jgi:hypothetical protein